MALLRQIRSSVTLAVLWGCGWALTGVALGAYRALFGRPHLIASMDFVIRNALITGTALGIAGAVAGMSFAGLLARAGRRRTLDELTAGSVARWGAAAGVLLPTGVFLIALAGGAPVVIATRFIIIAATVTAGVGAASAVGTLKLAQRQPRSLAP